MRMLRNIWDFFAETWFGFLLAGLFILGIFAVIEDAKQWAEFKVTHECKIVGRMSGDTFTTINSNGSIGVGSTPDKTGWACNDGVTYWK